MAKIIIAEDDPLIQSVYMEVLGSRGYEVVCFDDGEKALHEFTTSSADLVIADFQMPGMDGFELCKEIRRLPYGFTTPIIMVSAYGDEGTIMSGLNAGANDYLLKPIKHSELLAKVNSFLGAAIGFHRDFELARNHAVYAERYRLEKILGFGTHATVFLTIDLQKGATAHVALKLLNDNISDKGYIEAFLNTAKLLKELDCDHIVKVFDYGQYARRYFMTLEYADGGNLAEYLQEHKKLDEPGARKLALSIVKALKVYEGKGILHMDVKPENILLVKSDYKLGDIGISVHGNAPTTPLDEKLWGTPAYLSPELISNDQHELTISSDIYALGITIYQTLTGANPFQSENPARSMFLHISEKPMPLAEKIPGVSVDFSDIVHKMLNKKPADRPSLDELEQFFTNK